MVKYCHYIVILRVPRKLNSDSVSFFFFLTYFLDNNLLGLGTTSKAFILLGKSSCTSIRLENISKIPFID